MTRAYYNEWDPYAAAWLRNLITAGLVAAGDVDERSIADVTAGDLAGYTQVHFFAGIGGWSYALRLAGWPDSRPVWTGSCPCQPFSCAGKGKGVEDERHLWPEMRRLVTECSPPVCFGEQVASAAGRGWLSGVRLDLEALGYVVGAADLCAAGIGEKGHPLIKEAQRFAREMAARELGSGSADNLAGQLLDFADYLDGVIVGAPHIRQRLWWVSYANVPGEHGRPSGGQQPIHHANDGDVRRLADAWSHAGESRRSPEQSSEGAGAEGSGAPVESGRCGVSSRLVHAPGDGREQRRAESGGGSVAGGRGTCGMGNADNQGLEGRGLLNGGCAGQRIARTTGFWDSAIPIPCGDGKARRLEPGIAPLASGLSARVVRLRGYGNAINPYVAAEFVKACEEVLTR